MRNFHRRLVTVSLAFSGVVKTKEVAGVSLFQIDDLQLSVMHVERSETSQVLPSLLLTEITQFQFGFNDSTRGKWGAERIGRSPWSDSSFFRSFCWKFFPQSIRSENDRRKWLMSDWKSKKKHESSIKQFNLTTETVFFFEVAQTPRCVFDWADPVNSPSTSIPLISSKNTACKASRIPQAFRETRRELLIKRSGARKQKKIPLPCLTFDI